VICLAGFPSALYRAAPQAVQVAYWARVWVNATHPLMQQSTRRVS